ncbi:MAG: hypothetical protein OXM61_17395 [Candidatus Poribacteria bacterium]|nr:hypothetical protein [Candidatus Poribacteria bacterium]
MPNKVSIKPAELSLEQAVSVCHMLDYEGRQAFLGVLTEVERDALVSAMFQPKDEVVIKRVDGTECNGTVITYNKDGYYRVAYAFNGKVVIGDKLHHSRICIGNLPTE